MFTRMIRSVLGPARDPLDRKVYHQISLIAFLAWVGIGADGLSSSCYGPEECFKALGDHRFLAVFLALATAATVSVISAGYATVIEAFPSGGGGYVVASKLLGRGPGLVAGCALLVDYVLTITVSIASGADAIFSFLPADWRGIAVHDAKLPLAAAAIVVLTLLNLRGVKESVLALLPLFLLFIATHAAVILAAVLGHAEGLPAIVGGAVTDVSQSVSSMGLGATLVVFLSAYSLGAGTYTGIESVSNSMQILREPRVETGKRTMLYMAFSLAFVSGGILLGYLLLDIRHEDGKTFNAVLVERVAAGWGAAGRPFVLVTLLSEAALLFVAAQAGFIGGPRMMAIMAVDRWLPQRFSRLSDRLVTQDGILLMGGGAVAFLLLTGGEVHTLVVLYSINVFVTFVLSQLGMVRHGWQRRRLRGWKPRIAVNAAAFLLCAFILAVMLRLKLAEGAWLTGVVTSGLCLAAWLVRRHYQGVARTLRDLDRLVVLDPTGGAATPATVPVPDPRAPTAVLLVSGFNGVGLHSLLAILRLFPGHFRNWVFIMVGVIDFDRFKGADEIENLRRSVDEQLGRYAEYVRRLGYPAETHGGLGLDPVDEMLKVCPAILRDHPRAVFFGGQLIFPEETLLTPVLHSGAIYEVQRRLQFMGIPVMVLPIRVTPRPGTAGTN